MKAISFLTLKLKHALLTRYTVILLLLLMCSCRGVRFLNRHHLVQNNGTVNISKTPTEAITVHYIGCSGFFIQKGENTILTDPYFTYKSGLKKLTDEHNISESLSNEIDNIFNHAIGTDHDLTGIIKALLISHAHIDHLGDVPYLYKSHRMNNRTPVYGNTTAGHYIRGNGITDVQIVNNVEASASSWLSDGSWIWVNRNIRILPIVSEHGPHIRILGLKINLASGRYEMEDTRYNCPLHYGTGQTLSYLIDFLNNDSTINFRIYHSSASSNSPYGFPPASVLAQHRIDLEILCAASFNQVNHYPLEIIRYLNPRHILISHWEDFMFSKIAGLKKHPHTNPFYSYRKFFRRFNQVMHDLNNNRPQGDTITYTFPNVDTKMTFRY